MTTMAGAAVRYIVDGVGGRQNIVEDPARNPFELSETTIPEARVDNE